MGAEYKIFGTMSVIQLRMTEVLANPVWGIWSFFVLEIPNKRRLFMQSSMK
jgi:hypothetical protein